MRELTPKQERFTRNLFEGMSQREAYVQAGYSEKSAISTIDENACRLAGDSKVVARLNNLNQQAIGDSVSTVVERKQRLTEIHRARLTDFVECGADGAWINIGLDSVHSAALQEITSKTEYDENGDKPTVITKIKLHDPVKSISELNKMDRIYTDGDSSPTQDNRQYNIVVLSDNTKDVIERLLNGERRQLPTRPDSD
ncbi:hypothetical protein LCGC14_0890660 [marine sediment metagenome]|uniref:Terminase small subunit n=1 Tax=marine sediment metagenome TaxID=412755 RepID=A0A0F9P480_9ZZZZ